MRYNDRRNEVRMCDGQRGHCNVNEEAQREQC